MKCPCPDCGTDVDLADQSVRFSAGTCGSCGRQFSLLSGGTLPAALPAASTSAEEGEAEATGKAAVVAGPPCPECGGVLELTASGRGRLGATCSDCDSEFTYVLQTEGGEPEERHAPRERRPRAFEEGEARARPCRRCGEPLTFSTNPDGTVTGSCAACGNRFTLPPRRTGGWEGRGRRPYAPRSDRGPGGGGRWSGGPRGRGRFPPRRREGASRDDEERPNRRRRPRRDEDSD